MLTRADFSTLTRTFEQFQDDFEADPKRETWPMDAADAFDTPEVDLDLSLDAWVAATPDSFAPYLARGTHRIAVGWAKRGNEYRSKTPAENFSEMNKAFALARQRMPASARRATSRRASSSTTRWPSRAASIA